MMMSTTKILFLIIAFLWLTGAHEYSKRYYKDCVFDYNDPSKDWANLDCIHTCDPKHYYVQSPVSIKSETHDPILESLKFENYSNYSGQLVNNGHTAVLVFPENYEGGFGRYKLEQIHFHTDAENLDLGFKERHEMEIHLVHIDRLRDRRVVLAIFADEDVGTEVGQHSWFNAFIEAIPKVSSPNASTPIELNGLNRTLQNLKDKKLDAYWTFIGSLTTPPCTEGVQWFVMKTVLKVNSTVLGTFKKALPLSRNNRPVQRVLEGVSSFDPNYEKPPQASLAILATLAIVVVVLVLPFGFLYWKRYKKQKIIKENI